MSSHVKISLVTVCYNGAATLQAALASVFAQKGADYEYIVVDGSSADGTVDLLREWEPKFNGRMVWTSGPDGGMYDALNKGIARATGDVIGILNADDMLENEHVLADVAAAFSDGIDAVYADMTPYGLGMVHVGCIGESMSVQDQLARQEAIEKSLIGEADSEAGA